MTWRVQIIRQIWFATKINGKLTRAGVGCVVKCVAVFTFITLGECRSSGKSGSDLESISRFRIWIQILDPDDLPNLMGTSFSKVIFMMIRSVFFQRHEPKCWTILQKICGSRFKVDDLQNLRKTTVWIYVKILPQIHLSTRNIFVVKFSWRSTQSFYVIC